MQQAR